MLIVLSPSKTLDDSVTVNDERLSQPELLPQAEALIKRLRGLKEEEIAALMELSPKLSALNAARYREFSTPFTPQNARPALLAFKGDVYAAMRAETYGGGEFLFAQKHLRILSGLYGVLRPLDLMQPYRLEMGTALAVEGAKNLYQFWGETITRALNAALPEAGGPLINLASEEYFKAVRPMALQCPVIHIDFKEKRGNQLQTIGLMAKKARGRMADFIIRGRRRAAESLKDFAVDGYGFEPELSDAGRFTFVRG